ncbi:MAG: hypothetical protein Q9226_008732, partial [Calogaya cf. arnoldii]
MSTTNDADGIHFADRSRTAPPPSGGAYTVRRSEKFVPTLTKRSTAISEKSVEFFADDTDERDIKKKQEFKGRYFFWLAYQSVGVIYGDIGTSPLYVYSSTFTSDPSHDDLLGALSLIIWTLTLMVSIKYVLIVLRADDEGEGGTFAVYSLLSRYVQCPNLDFTCFTLADVNVKVNIVARDPREERTINIERVKTSDLAFPNKATRSFLEKSKIMKILLKVIGVFGVSLVMSGESSNTIWYRIAADRTPDGVLTPAQSVLGAVQGLKVVDDSITTATIVGVTCAILILLFLSQPLGTSNVGSAFAPIVIIWLLFNLCFGIYNLVQFDHSVLRAFSPYFAGAFFVRNKTEGWKSLGGILLAFTGVEALFADLGAFTRRSIQLSWLCFAYPCLLLAYIGQAAYISRNTGAYSNPFYNSVPPKMFYPSLVIAILAAIVASQAMITATFQLLSQIVKLSYIPQIKVVHTSKIFHQQIYVPSVNWLLMIGTICVTAAYKNTTKLGEAYGVCVILVTFITTLMVSLVALLVWCLPIYVVVPCFLVFATLDGLYLSSALLKLPNGAWFTLVLAVFLSSIFVLWRFGKENQWRAEASDKVAPWNLFSETYYDDDDITSDEPELRFTDKLGGGHISRLRGIGVFFDKTGAPNATPAVFVHFLQKFQAAPTVTVFFHIRPLTCPSVAPEDRFSVSRCRKAGLDPNKDGAKLRNIYCVTIRHGYTDSDIVSSDLGLLIYENIRAFIIREGALKDVDMMRVAAVTTYQGSTTNEGGRAAATPDTTLPSTDDSGTETSNHMLVRYRRNSVRHHLAALQAV